MKTKVLIIVFLLTFAFLCVFFVEAYYGYKYPLKYKDVILQEASTNNLDPALVASIINAESRFETMAVSSKGAIGLMQIMPKTADFVAQKIGIKLEQEMLFDPSINIKIGCYYLNYLSLKFKEKNTLISAYNAGEGVVKSWLKNNEYSTNGVTLIKIPYEQTNIYVRKINHNYNVYKNMF